MKIDFTGKKAIVCGGSRGIGRAIALGFAACGGDVSICARDPKALEETRAEIAKLGRKGHAKSADLAKGEDVDAVLEALSRGLTQKMLHGTLAELRAGDAEMRAQTAQTVSRLFLRSQSKPPHNNGL